jgi:predicted type IV restriction endonuclease
METVATWGPEAGFAEFTARLTRLSELASTSNEAETRLKLIDELLFEVLDWEKDDVEVEKYCRDVGYADYVFCPQIAKALILEAKRVGASFTLPEAQFKTEPVAFGLLESESKNAGEALRQVIGYAASLGSRYIAISNGYQWIFCLTYVQGQALEDRQVIVFDSLSSISDNFRLFWTCFSKASIARNEVYSLLLESRKKPAPPKFSSTVPGYPVPSHRNRFVNELSYILNTV